MPTAGATTLYVAPRVRCGSRLLRMLRILVSVDLGLDYFGPLVGLQFTICPCRNCS